MSRLRIWPDPILSEVSAPVEEFGDDLADLITDLLREIYTIKARALAAPQIGVLQRVFVMDLGWQTGRRTPRAFVNPEIIDKADRMVVTEERCHSLPDQPRRIARPFEVEIRWRESDGERQRDWFNGLAAVAVMHDIDHLDGRTILDHPEAP